ncbi:MAG: lipopolysaccharide biosynthesis protein [Clostridiales bacterium]|nr:lipopolysaccharide biosynthesis protein [Clostridiales bacterium]
MNGKKRIFKSTITYFLGSVLSKIIVFFMLPLYTKYIPAADMGYYDSSIAVITFFASVLFLDIGSGIMRFMFEQKEQDNKKYAIYSGLAIFLISLILYIVIAILGAFTLEFEYIIWIIIYGFMLCLNNVYGYITRGYGANSLYAASGIVSTIVTVACNLIFILALKWDYKSLYISSIIAMVVHIIILEFKCKLLTNLSKKYFDKDLFKKMLKFSLPLCVNSVAFWFLNSSNKIIVTTILGSEYNGYLAIASRFTSILYLVSSCFQLAWQELAYSRDNKLESTGIFYTKAFDLYLRILIAGLLLLIPLIRLGLIIYPNFINAQYSDSIVLIPLALTGTIMSIASSFLGSIFGGIKKNNAIFISTLVGAIVNIGVIFALINIMGVMAANIAFIAGFTATVLIRTLILKKEINMKVKHWYFAALLPILAAVIYVFNELNWVYNLLVFLAITVLCAFMLRPEIKEIIDKVKIRRKEKVK